MKDYLIYLVFVIGASFGSSFISALAVSSVFKKISWPGKIVGGVLGIISLVAVVKFCWHLVEVKADSPDAGGLAWLAEGLLEGAAIILFGLPAIYLGVKLGCSFIQRKIES